MSELCPFPENIPPRLAVRVQRAALAPFPFPRIGRAPWHLTRKPYDFRELTEFGWQREEKLKLGEEGLALGVPAMDTGADNRSPAQQQRARGAGGFIACPDYRTLALVAHHAAVAADTWAAVSSEVLPAPCRIEELTLWPLDLSLSNFFRAKCMLVDEELNGTFASVQGEELIAGTKSHDAGSLTATWRRGEGFALPNIVSTQSHPPILHIGRTITETGKRLAFAILNTAGGITDIKFVVYATVQLCTGGAALQPVSATSSERRARPPAAPVPRVAPPPPVAPAPRGHTSSGAYPVMAGVSPEGHLIQRWVLPENPGRSFATLAEAEVAYRAMQVSSLPFEQRAAEERAVRIAAGQLIYGQGELRTPVTLLTGRPRG